MNTKLMRDAWRQMIRRCHEPSAKDYPRYGGRGVSVCERWLNSFEEFIKDMGHRPEGTSLDRIDNRLGYEPSNCRWATASTQNRNKIGLPRIGHLGESLLMAEWAERTGLSTQRIYQRLRAGWSVEKALTAPVAPRRRAA